MCITMRRTSACPAPLSIPGIVPKDEVIIGLGAGFISCHPRVQIEWSGAKQTCVGKYWPVSKNLGCFPERSNSAMPPPSVLVVPSLEYPTAATVVPSVSAAAFSILAILAFGTRAGDAVHRRSIRRIRVDLVKVVDEQVALIKRLGDVSGRQAALVVNFAGLRRECRVVQGCSEEQRCDVHRYLSRSMLTQIASPALDAIRDFSATESCGFGTSVTARRKVIASRTLRANVRSPF